LLVDLNKIKNLIEDDNKYTKEELIQELELI